MPINETLIGDGLSAELTPLDSMTDVVIAGEAAAGLVFLQVKAFGGIWVNVTNQSGAYVVMTPDPTLLYRFRASNLLSPVHVFMGP